MSALAVSGCADSATVNDIKPDLPKIISEKPHVVNAADGNFMRDSKSVGDILAGIPQNSNYYPPEKNECDIQVSELVEIGVPYENLRKKILTAGYVAYQDNEYHECRIDEYMIGWRVEWCKENPEIEASAPTGTGPRRMTWMKKGSLVRIYTNGEDPIVSGVECRKI